MNNLLADLQIAPNGGFKGLGTSQLAVGTGGITTFTKFLSSIIGLMTIIAVIWFVFTFITGAISFMTAGEDKQALEGAKKKITNGIIGLTITIAAVALISLIGYLLGFSSTGGILNLNEMFTLIQ